MKLQEPVRATLPLPKIDAQVWRVASVVLLGPFMTTLDSTVVNVSLSTMAEQLKAPLSSAQWVITGYLLALALMLPLTGWLVDRIGAKRVYLGCFSLFTAASLLCGLATSMNELILFRTVQGMAGGLLAPMGQMMIARVAGPNMARVMGYTVIPVLIAPILGPVVAGAVLKYASWPWLFYLNLPVGALALIMAMTLLPADDADLQPRPFDLKGFLLLSPSLVFLLFGLEQFKSPFGKLLFGAGIVLMLRFLFHASAKGKKALVDIALFKVPHFARASLLQFFANGVLFAGQMLVPLFLIGRAKWTPSFVGFLLAPTGLGMLISVIWIGTLTERFGPRKVATTGAVIALFGSLPFLLMMDGQIFPIQIAACLFLRGLGMGAIAIPSMAAAYASVPKSDLPVATTAINIVQRVGGPLATTVTAILISQQFNFVYLPPFLFLVGLHAVIVGAATRLPSNTRAQASAASALSE